MICGLRPGVFVLVYVRADLLAADQRPIADAIQAHFMQLRIAPDAGTFRPTPLAGAVLGVLVYLLVVLAQTTIATEQALRLPGKSVPRPPQAEPDPPRTLVVQADDTIVLSGVVAPLSQAQALLRLERDALLARGRPPALVTVIVQADRGVPTGKVRELIASGERVGFERFVLRQRDRERAVDENRNPSVHRRLRGSTCPGQSS